MYKIGSDAYENILAGEWYYLAMTCAHLGKRTEMLDALCKCVSVNTGYCGWARAHGEFEPYRNDPDFIEICGTGEGSLGMIR